MVSPISVNPIFAHECMDTVGKQLINAVEYYMYNVHIATWNSTLFWLGLMPNLAIYLHVGT